MKQTILARSLAVLAVSGLLAGFTADAVPRAAQAATRTYVHTFINEPESPLRVRPSTIHVQGSGGISYGHLRWRSWGASRAQADGRQCSARSSTCQAVRIRLSDRKIIHGRRVYTCLQPLLSGEIKMCLP